MAGARDLRASLARIRMYAPDGRTASVLVQHARGRVEDTYSAFRQAARQGARAGAGQNNCCWMMRRLRRYLWRRGY